MDAIRSHPGNTTQNRDTALALLTNPACTQLRLFASPTTDEGEGRSTNLPIMTALAIMAVPGGTQYVVHDGLFLTAARQPRYQEIRALLDSAENNAKAWVGTYRAPFTDEMTPSVAAATLMAVPMQNLTTATRKSFFQLLCSISEEAYAAL